MGDYRVWQTKQGVQPPVLVPLLGLRVTRAWLRGQLFVARFADGRILSANGGDIGPRGVEGVRAVELTVGTVAETWSDEVADEAMGQSDPRLIELRGQPFAGMDGDVVMFGEPGAEVGVMLRGHRAQWVKAK